MKTLFTILLLSIFINGYSQRDMPIDTLPKISKMDVFIKLSYQEDFLKANEIIERTQLHYKVLIGTWRSVLTDSIGYYYCEVPDTMHTVVGKPSRMDYIFNPITFESIAVKDGVITLAELQFLLSNYGIFDRNKLKIK